MDRINAGQSYVSIISQDCSSISVLLESIVPPAHYLYCCASLGTTCMVPRPTEAVAHSVVLMIQIQHSFYIIIKRLERNPYSCADLSIAQALGLSTGIEFRGELRENAGQPTDG